MENSSIPIKLALTASCFSLSGALLALPMSPIKTPGASLMLKVESTAPEAAQTALKPGTYWGGGSRYLSIAQRGDRYCLQGASPNGVLVTSLQPINAEQYQAYETNWKLQQRGDVLLFGAMEYQPKGELDPASLFPELNECLESQTGYFKQVWSREAASEVVSPEK
ncbi:MAG TPA: hypothetical protein IGS53_26545 [Leptolyngbyaceae cyanobacterium M33_DOE_097]|uniref:Uncharacterized protein n=1 Tax=Oscillatoriales cyanobacterium SpSt-418 TaxID=2282169 RepID=A0A7C3KDY8_9CYAN|nr:hypothetical protein [Leptolyngbyaceae cyanobacterium M33_DOE_097]